MVFPFAGSFPYHCKDTNHASTMHGVVHVKVGRTPFDGSSGRRSRSSGRRRPPTPGYVFDVQMKHGTGAFKSFRKGVTSAQAQFAPQQPGQYQFRGRVRDKATGQASGFSPPSSLFVYPP